MRRRIMTALLVIALGTSAPGAPGPTRPGRLAVGVTTAGTLDETRGNRPLPVEIGTRQGARGGTPSPSGDATRSS
jgi:hypothetical protein